MLRNLRRRPHAVRESPSGRFASDIGQMILEFRWLSLAIVAVTVLQEIASLRPVNLLGRFIDGLGSPETGRTVVLLFGASLPAPPWRASMGSFATGCSTGRISGSG